MAEEKIGGSGSGDQILSTLRNAGVKENEIKWMGLDDYLSGKSKVSKSDLQQFIRDNQIQLEETTKGGSHAERLERLGAQRNKVFAENNGIWANSLRREPLSPEMFNEMAETGNPESVISRMPAGVQAQARRFVETNQQITALDKQIADLGKQASRAKFEAYTLPGEKQNYSEMLLQLPDKTKPQIDALNTRLSEMSNRPSAEHAAHPEWKGEWDSIQAQKNALLRQPEFKSTHFDEPNILAHVRFNDRTTVDGAKTLFLEEIQSDWHQQGKKYGYQTPDKYVASRAFDTFRQSLQDRYGTAAFSDKVTPEEKQQYGQLVEAADRETANGKNRTIPDAPFKSDWHELAMKRMLRHAAENEYDKLAWTTGDQQAARYDLSKQVSESRMVSARGGFAACRRCGGKRGSIVRI